MQPILALFILVSCLWGPKALSKEIEPDFIPTPPAVEITPELFPTPTPPPLPQAPEESVTPEPVPSVEAVAPSLEYEFPRLVEGRLALIKLYLKGQSLSVQYPVTGRLIFENGSYDHSKITTETVAFQISEVGSLTVPVIFRTSGKKTIRIETDLRQIAPRNVLAYVEPFEASIFPHVLAEKKWSKDPKDWHVWVNLYTDYRQEQSQRQYYMVTYKGEIMQKLLTSGAAPGRITPQGRFTLGTKMAAPHSTKYASLMPFWSTISVPGFSYEYGNHGLLGESYLYYLGMPASHGCLRLSNKWVKVNGKSLNIGGAKWVYSHVPVGTPIHIFRRVAQPFGFESYTMWLARRNK